MMSVQKTKGKNLSRSSEDLYKVMRCLGEVLKGRRRVFNGELVEIIGYDEQKRAIMVRSLSRGDILYLRKLAEVRKII